MSSTQQFANAQWGFQNGKSTVTALLATTYDWFQMLDSGKDMCAVFFDIQKAFDTIPHYALTYAKATAHRSKQSHPTLDL